MEQDNTQPGLSEATTEVEDPILKEEVSYTMTVAQVNILLSLLGKLPYENSAEAIAFFRDNGIAQLQEKQKAKKGQDSQS